MGPKAIWREDLVTSLLSTFLERMKCFGLEGKTLLYELDRRPEGGAGVPSFIGCTASQQTSGNSPKPG